MDDFAQLLKEKGYRVTEGRLRLLRILKDAATPLSVRDILKRMKGVLLDQVTLYRALESFSKNGVITRVDLNTGVARYEFENKHHHHVVCTDCGIIEDVKECLLPITPKSNKFKSIYSHNLEFFGLCRSCSKYS